MRLQLIVPLVFFCALASSVDSSGVQEEAKAIQNEEKVRGRLARTAGGFGWNPGPLDSLGASAPGKKKKRMEDDDGAPGWNPGPLDSLGGGVLGKKMKHMEDDDGAPGWNPGPLDSLGGGVLGKKMKRMEDDHDAPGWNPGPLDSLGGGVLGKKLKRMEGGSGWNPGPLDSLGASASGKKKKHMEDDSDVPSWNPGPLDSLGGGVLGKSRKRMEGSIPTIPDGSDIDEYCKDKDGHKFHIGCSMTCTCSGRDVSCVSQCPPSPGPYRTPECNPIKVVVPGECCKRWVCEEKKNNE